MMLWFHVSMYPIPKKVYDLIVIIFMWFHLWLLTVSIIPNSLNQENIYESFNCNGVSSSNWTIILSELGIESIESQRIFTRFKKNSTWVPGKIYRPNTLKFLKKRLKLVKWPFDISLCQKQNTHAIYRLKLLSELKGEFKKRILCWQRN